MIPDRRRLAAALLGSTILLGAASALARTGAPTRSTQTATGISHRTTGTSHGRRPGQVANHRPTTRVAAG